MDAPVVCIYETKAQMTVAKALKNGTYFHVCIQKNYVPFKPMARGDTFVIGNNHNPFFAFYEDAKNYTVTTPDGPITVPALRFLRQIHRGEIECPDLPKQALAIANHYNILARELIMEDARRQTAPDAPSRKTCLWVTDELGLAKYWQTKLSKRSYIVRLDLQGAFHKGDATLLMNESEPISETYAKATRYWKGKMGDDPLPEILFTGAGVVVEDHIS